MPTLGAEQREVGERRIPAYSRPGLFLTERTEEPFSFVRGGHPLSFRPKLSKTLFTARILHVWTLT